MRYPATDKLEIIRLVENSHLGVKRTLAKLGVSRTTFNRWYDLYARFHLENYFLQGDLEAAIGAFVGHYNHQRYHESLKNLTPADVYFGRGQTILFEREKIKRKTIQLRRLQHSKTAA